MAVGVPGSRVDPPLARPGDLRADLGRDLGEVDAAGEEPGRELWEPVEPAVRVDERRDPAAVAQRCAADEVEVESDLEARLVPREIRGLLAARERDEERGRPHHAVAVRLEDPPRDTRREAEVVGTHDDRVHR